jgi:hypothetical protein
MSTELTIALRDSHGRKLGSWREHAKAGGNAFILLLPSAARKPGHDVLQVNESGNPTATKRGVTLVA